MQTLKYESDKYVPTEERKQGAFGVGFLRKQWGHWVWYPKRIGLFGCELPKIRGSFGVNVFKFGENLPFLAQNWQNF